MTFEEITYVNIDADNRLIQIVKRNSSGDETLYNYYDYTDDELELALNMGDSGNPEFEVYGKEEEVR